MAATPVTDWTRAQKVAVLLVAMGTEKAADVVRHLEPSEVRDVANEIVALDAFDRELAQTVIDDFAQFVVQSTAPRGGAEYARALLEKALGPERAEQLLGRPDDEHKEDAIEALREADPDTLLRRLRGEMPQIVALTLTSLPVAAGAAVLSSLPADAQLEVATRVATMTGHRPEVAAKLAEVLQRQESPSESGAQVAEAAEETDDGPQRLVDLLMQADRETEQHVLDSLTQQSPELAQQVRDRMFVFEDLVHLEAKALQLAIRQVEMSDLCLALKGADDEIKEAVFKNMSERAAAGLKEDLETLTSARPRDIGAAQKKVVAAIIELANQGQIQLKPEPDSAAEAATAEEPAAEGSAPEEQPAAEEENSPSA